jgi:hypothetical protein
VKTKYRENKYFFSKKKSCLKLCRTIGNSLGDRWNCAGGYSTGKLGRLMGERGLINPPLKKGIILIWELPKANQVEIGNGC